MRRWFLRGWGGISEMRIAECGMRIEEINSEIRNPNSEIEKPMLPARPGLASRPTIEFFPERNPPMAARH
jgi:hypothetical protein